MIVMTPTDTTPQRHPHIFTLTLGDPSGDGHSETRTLFLRVMCLSNDLQGRIDEIKAAYDAAKEKAPELEPSTYCAEYCEDELPDDVRELWLKWGEDPPETLYADDYSKLCAAFLNIGNPALKATVTNDPTPSLDPVFGRCGYGLFD
jgi:hypothetical protein